jgi:hypothetical protein
MAKPCYSIAIKGYSMETVRISTFQSQAGKIAVVSHDYALSNLRGIFSVCACQDKRIGHSVIQIRQGSPRYKYSPLFADALMAELLHTHVPDALSHIEFSGSESATSDEMLADISHKKFDVMNLPGRVANLLYNVGMQTIGDVVRLDDKTLLSIPDLSFGGLATLRKHLSTVRINDLEQNIDFARRLMGVRSWSQERIPRPIVS